MDALDIRILRTMGVTPYGRHPRPPLFLRPADFAAKVGATKARVKERIAKMEALGVIRGYQITPNYQHLGLESTCYFYRFADDEAVDRAMERLQPLDGVMGCYAFLGGILCVEVVHGSLDTLNRRLKVLAEVAGEGGVHKFYDIEMPPVSRPLSHMDWRIIQALRGNAARPLAEVAKDLGVSLKTVRRRFDRMGMEGSFFITPRFDPSRAQGALMFYLNFHLDPEADVDPTRTLMKLYDAQLLATDIPTNMELGNLTLALHAASMAEVDELRRKGTKVRGVARTEPFLFRNVAMRGGWQDELIADRVRTSEAGPMEPRAVAKAAPVAMRQRR